jgi:uncharacterized protein
MYLERFKDVQNSLLPCTPPLWASTGHLQTLWGHFLPSPSLQGGESLDVTVGPPEERIRTVYHQGNIPVVIYLFHGLGGSSEASYMQRTALMACSLGFHVFLNNHRGCGEGVGLASEPYHSGRAEDLSSVIEFGRTKFPQSKHIAIGFSLSANALLLLAANFRGRVQPDAAIAVNAPINLERASINLTQGVNWIYNLAFMQDLKGYIKKNRPADYKGVKRIWNLRTFDQKYTAPLGGFKDRDDYFNTCSAKNYLKDISIPTVIISSFDDPFVSVVDYLDAQVSPFVHLHLERVGGHMGYLTQQTSGSYRWLDLALEKYLQALI